MGKQTDIIVDNLHAHAMIGIHRIERHIGSGIHRLRIMLEASQLHRIGYRDIQFLFLTGRSGIKRRFHRPVMAERHILLRLNRQSRQQ